MQWEFSSPFKKASVTWCLESEVTYYGFQLGRCISGTPAPGNYLQTKAHSPNIFSPERWERGCLCEIVRVSSSALNKHASRSQSPTSLVPLPYCLRTIRGTEKAVRLSTGGGPEESSPSRLGPRDNCTEILWQVSVLALGRMAIEKHTAPHGKMIRLYKGKPSFD